MKTIKLIGLAVFAVIALGVAAASASAAEFHAEGVLPSELTAESLGSQEFRTGLATIICTEEESQKGTVTEETFPSLSAEVGYLGCTLKTFLGGVYPVHHINAEYLFDANGDVHVLKLIDIEVLEFAGGCTITIPPQTVTKAVTYENDGGHVKINAKASGIEYSGCGLEGASEYVGESLVSATSGAELSYS